MATMSVQEFLTDARTVFLNQDSDYVYDLLSLVQEQDDILRFQKLLEQYSEPSLKEQAKAALTQNEIPKAYVDAVGNYLVCIKGMGDQSKTMTEIFGLVSVFCGQLMSVFQYADTEFLTATVMKVASDLYYWAAQADRENPYAVELKVAEIARTHLSKAFTVCINDKSTLSIESSKRWALFHIANVIMKSYFKLKTTRLISTLLNNISGSGANISEYPQSQQVTYNYYVGWYQLYQMNLRKSESLLWASFRNCMKYPSWFQHRRQILIPLTAVRICLGRFPKSTQKLQEQYGTHPPPGMGNDNEEGVGGEGLLEFYDLDRYFGPVIQAIKQGHLGDLKFALEGNQDSMDWFLHQGLFFLLSEKATVLTWRSLIRKTMLLNKQRLEQEQQQQGLPVQQKSIRIDFTDLLALASWSSGDYDLDMDDVEAIVASLLSQGYLRGYIHHQRRLLMLSAAKPVPPIYEVRVVEEAV